MFESTGHMGTLCKERNKLIGESNYLAWKKTIDLILAKSEVMEYDTGEITEPRKEKTQELAKNKKGEARDQRIIVDLIMYSLIPFVAKLKASKGMHDKLVYLYSVSTIREKINFAE